MMSGSKTSSPTCSCVTVGIYGQRFWGLTVENCSQRLEFAVNGFVARLMLLFKRPPQAANIAGLELGVWGLGFAASGLGFGEA